VSFCPFKVDVSGNGVADSGYEATAQIFENSFRISQIHTAIQQRRLSYEHVGQHGACSLKAIFSMTTECTEPEFTNLKEKLEELGYRLNVVDGCTKEHQDARQRALNDAMTTA
jgi:hypothetical protein